jgi:hypothetical protein
MGKENVMSSTPAKGGKKPKKAGKLAKTKSAATKKKSPAVKTKKSAAPAKAKPKAAASKKPVIKAAKNSGEEAGAKKKTSKKIIQIPGLKSRIDSKIDTEKVVDRIAVLLDAIAGTSAEIEEKARAEAYEEQASLHKAGAMPSNVLPDNEMQAAVNVLGEGHMQSESGQGGLRFTFDHDSREDGIIPTESEDSATISPILAEVGDIFQTDIDRDLIAEIEIRSTDSKRIPIQDVQEQLRFGLPEGTSDEVSITEEESGDLKDSPNAESVEPDDNEAAETEIEPESSEENIPEKQETGNIGSKIVLLRPAEDVRPQMDRPDFSDRRRRAKRPWSLDVDIALRDLMGDIPDPSRVDFEQMVFAWKRGYESYFSRSLAEYRFPYIWADVKEVDLGDSVRKTFLSFTGCDLKGRRHLLSLVEGKPSSAEIWQVMLKRLERRDLGNPRLFIGKNDLALWEVLHKVYPRAEIQVCWNDFTRKIMDIFPHEFSEKVKAMVNKIRHAPDFESSEGFIDNFKASFGPDNPRAVTEFIKCKQELLRYYSFPSIHWNYIKTSGRILGYFPTEAMMKTVCKFEQMQDISLYLIFNYILRSQRRWPRLKSGRALSRVQAGKRYFDGRKKPAKRNKKTPAVADKKNKGNMLQKMALSINARLGNLFGSSRKSLNAVKSQMLAGKPQNHVAEQPDNLSAMDLNAQKAELEDLLRDRMEAKKIGKDDHASAPMEGIKRIKSGIQPKKPGRAMSGLEREILEELKSEKNRYT